MTQEEKDLLLSLLSRLDEDGLLNVYDDEENFHGVERMFFDKGELYVKINKL